MSVHGGPDAMQHMLRKIKHICDCMADNWKMLSLHNGKQYNLQTTIAQLDMLKKMLEISGDWVTEINMIHTTVCLQTFRRVMRLWKLWYHQTFTMVSRSISPCRDMQLSCLRLHLTTRRQERCINKTDFSGLQITIITKCTNIILCIVPKCTNLIMYRERIHMQAYGWHFVMI